MQEEFKLAITKVLEAWKGISDEVRAKFNEAAGGELVDALRALNTHVEGGALEASGGEGAGEGTGQGGEGSGAGEGGQGSGEGSGAGTGEGQA